MTGPLANRMKNLGQKPKPVIKIQLLDDQRDVFCPVYTSLDQIKGEVCVITSSDMAFEEIYITFEGAVKTYVEKVASTSPTNGRTEGFSQFLRLVQPMDDAEFPESRVIKAGVTYKFPFTFNVPEALLPSACRHPKNGTFPQDCHLRLPPSLGDPMVATMGKSLMDDMAPDMGSIAYAIRCRVTKGRGRTGRLLPLAEATKKLRIIPAVQEEPPMNVSGGSEDDYRLRKEKSVKKGIFRGKLGRLVAESAQPNSLRLPQVRAKESCPVTTMASVNIRFDPAGEDCEPPRLGSLQVKLRILTYFATIPMHDIPRRERDFYYSSVRGFYSENVNLSSRCLANQQWDKHAVNLDKRPDSSRTPSPTTPGIPKPSSAYQGKTFYTAQVVVPISLPKGNKVFVPTFHSCLVSRVYLLDLYLSTSGSAATNSSTHLRLPVQISAEGNPNAEPAISAEEANAIAARQANEFFNPRNIAPPIPEYTEQAQLGDAPPNPGPDYTHRAPSVSIDGGPSPQYSVRMMGAQPRFQSLSFEGEEAALAPPPDYSAYPGRNRERNPSTVPPSSPSLGQSPRTG